MTAAADALMAIFGFKRVEESDMSKKNDGGPAFPVPNDANVNGQEGMTLRDYFAAKALNALICGAPGGTSFGVDHMYTNMNYALASYAIADSMLAAREPQQ